MTVRGGDREPIDAEFVEVASSPWPRRTLDGREDEPWPAGWPASLRGLPRCATCETYAYGGAREQVPVAVAGVRHHPSCPEIRGAGGPARTRSVAAGRDARVVSTATDKARDVSALLAAGSAALAEGSRAVSEVAVAADEIEGGISRARRAGERLGGRVAEIGGVLKRMGVIGEKRREPMGGADARRKADK